MLDSRSFLVIHVKYSSASMYVPQFSKFLIKQKEVRRREEEGREMEFNLPQLAFLTASFHPHVNNILKWE